MQYVNMQVNTCLKILNGTTDTEAGRASSSRFALLIDSSTKAALPFAALSSSNFAFLISLLTKAFATCQVVSTN